MVTLAVALAVLLAPSTGMAADPLPVGQADGVRVERQRGAVVLLFGERAADLYRRIAGRRIVVECRGLPKGPDGAGRSSGGETRMTAPRRRRPLRPGEGSRGLDYCRVWLGARKVVRGDATTHYPRQLIVSVPLTQLGAVHVDESVKALMLQVVLGFASGGRPERDGYMTAAELLETTGGSLWRTPFWRRPPRIVALASPAGVLHTNVAEYVFRDPAY